MKRAPIWEGHQHFQTRKSQLPVFREGSPSSALWSSTPDCWRSLFQKCQFTCLKRKFILKQLFTFFSCCLSQPREPWCWPRIVSLFNCLLLKNVPCPTLPGVAAAGGCSKKGRCWGVDCCYQYISKHAPLVTRTGFMCSKTLKCLLATPTESSHSHHHPLWPLWCLWGTVSAN